jgi:hypothetical protein
MLTWFLRPGRNAQIWVVGMGIAVSFLAAVLITPTDSNAAFFLLHTRAWEMLSGGFLFLLSKPFDLSSAQKQKLELIGLFFIALAVVLFDSATAWPGWRAALPVIGAVLVLAANQSSFWTGNRAAQWLGDRSYSLYLWHWPVYVGLVYAEINANLFAIILALILTVLLGHLSFVFVENNSRRWLSNWRLGAATVGLAIASLAVALPAVVVWKLEGVKGRFKPEVELAAAEGENDNPRRDECHPSSGLNIKSCVYGGEIWQVIALGDSHASALITAIAAANEDGQGGAVQWSYSGCSFVPGMKHRRQPKNADYQCEKFITWAQEQLKLLRSNIPVVLINRYASNAFGPNEDAKVEAVPGVYFSKHYDRATPEFIDEFAKHITESACELAKTRDVYMVRPIPEMGFDVPKTLSRRLAVSINADLSITMEAYQARNGWVWAAQNAARDHCGVKILDSTEYLCRDGVCFGSLNGRPLYTDDDHLSEFGNKLLVPMFAQVYKSR